MSAVREIMGSPPEVLSGDEEGQLSFAGATAHLAGGTGGSQQVLVVDVGGGSTELSLGHRPTGREPLHEVTTRSVDVGCVRVSERFLRHDPPRPDELREARRAVEQQIGAARDALPAVEPDCLLVGLAGTVSTLASLEYGVAAYDRARIHHAGVRRAARWNGGSMFWAQSRPRRVSAVWAWSRDDRTSLSAACSFWPWSWPSLPALSASSPKTTSSTVWSRLSFAHNRPSGPATAGERSPKTTGFTKPSSILPAVLRIPPAIGASLWAWANRKPSSRSDYADRKELRRWLVWTCLAAVIVLLVSLAAGNHERYSHPFNVFDEGAHYDYALALSHGHIPRSGAQLSQQTLRDLSCVGGFGLPAHGCQTEQRNPADLPADGYSYEAVQQPPLGYLPYLVTVRASSSPHSGLVVARWGGFIWAVIAAGLLVWVGWLGDLSTLEVITVLAIGILSPVEVYAAAAVTNDSSAVAAGALVLGTALLARRRGKPTALAGLIVGIIVGFMKGLFVVAPFAVLIALVVADISKRRRPTRADFWTRYGCTLMMFVGSVASYAGMARDPRCPGDRAAERRTPCVARVFDHPVPAALDHSDRRARWALGPHRLCASTPVLDLESHGLREPRRGLGPPGYAHPHTGSSACRRGLRRHRRPVGRLPTSQLH